MSESQIVISEDWNANDYANIITISAAAISSVLLVVFKSRCKTIKLCFGMIDCIRDPMEEGEEITIMKIIMIIIMRVKISFQRIILSDVGAGYN